MNNKMRLGIIAGLVALVTIVITLTLPHSSNVWFWVVFIILLLSEIGFFVPFYLKTKGDFVMNLPKNVALGGNVVAQVVVLILSNAGIWQTIVIPEVIILLVVSVLCLATGANNERDEKQNVSYSENEWKKPKQGRL